MSGKIRTMGDGNGNVNGQMTTKELVLMLHEKVDRVLDDHEKRIRGLEKRSWALPASVFSAVMAAIGAIIAAVLSTGGGSPPAG